MNQKQRLLQMLGSGWVGTGDLYAAFPYANVPNLISELRAAGHRVQAEPTHKGRRGRPNYQYRLKAL